MSHLEHIFVSINGPWTGKIIPPVPLPISLVKVEEHNTLFWDEKGRQRDGNIKGSMSPAGTDPVGTGASSKLCLGLTTRGNLGLFLLITFHFPIDFHEFWVDFIRKGFLKVSWNPAEVSCSPGGWIQSGCLCCVVTGDNTSSHLPVQLWNYFSTPPIIIKMINNKIME